MINKAGNIIVPSSTSVSYAVMEQGGNFNSQGVATLVDGNAAYVWPLSGYTYFIIRSQTHIGSCSDRTQAMKFIYNFYHSNTVNDIANLLGFAALPSFIRDIVVNKLVSTMMCNDGITFALQNYRLSTAQVASTTFFSDLIITYSYLFENFVNTELSLSTLQTKHSYPTSSETWADFSSSPDNFIGVFTTFASGSKKLQVYQFRKRGLTFIERNNRESEENLK